MRNKFKDETIFKFLCQLSLFTNKQKLFQRRKEFTKHSKLLSCYVVVTRPAPRDSVCVCLNFLDLFTPCTKFGSDNASTIFDGAV